MVIHSNEFVQLEYDASAKRLIQTWYGFASSPVFREAIDKTVAFAQENPVLSIVSDTIKQKVVKPEDAEYAASVMPKLGMAGIKAMAFVVPESVFTKLSLQKFSKAQTQDNVQYFDKRATAIAWTDQLTKV